MPQLHAADQLDPGERSDGVLCLRLQPPLIRSHGLRREAALPRPLVPSLRMDDGQEGLGVHSAQMAS